ncbi:MAG: hypothetical protein WBA20_03195 [Ketobacter sp.]|nr:MAG: hypothetical protein D6160_12265 [Ketobacter sp.]
MTRGTYRVAHVVNATHKSSWPHVKLLSASSLELVGNISYQPDYVPLDLLVLADVDGESYPGLAALSVDGNTLQSKIEVRSLTGNLIQNSWLGKKFDSTAFVTSASTFSNTNEALTEIAVLQQKAFGLRKTCCHNRRVSARL